MSLSFTDDLIIKSLEEFVISAIVVPSSLIKISAPPASKTISVVAFNVIVEPEVISAMTGVVNVLFVSVCDPDKVVTVESIAKVTALPLPLVSIPVPPVNV